MLLMWQWQPIGGLVWSVEDEFAKTILFILYLSGWGIVFISTFLINHFDLFGLRQVWLYFNGKPYTPLPFRLPGFYRLVRHPLYLGFPDRLLVNTGNDVSTFIICCSYNRVYT